MMRMTKMTKMIATKTEVTVAGKMMKWTRTSCRPCLYIEAAN